MFFVYFLFAFLSLFLGSFFPFVTIKDIKILKKMILTSKRCPKHLFAPQNTLQVGTSLSYKVVRNFPRSITIFFTLSYISASLDEVDIQTSPMGNGTEDLNDGETYFEEKVN